MSYTFCAIRLAGDLAIFLSSPILIARIFARGVAGVSVTTQGFHLLVFLTRYLDLLSPRAQSISWTTGQISWDQWFENWYNPVMRIYLITSAIAVLAAIAYRNAKDLCASRSVERYSCAEGKQAVISFIKTFAVYTIPCFFLAYRFHAGPSSWLYWLFGLGNPMAPAFENPPVPSTHGAFDLVKGVLEFFSPVDLFNMSAGEFLEVVWSFSIFLSAVADIPQYVAYYHYLGDRQSLDWWLMLHMLATVSFRLFYIPHWVLRFSKEQSLDPVAFSCAVVQVFAFWMFFILCINKVNNTATDYSADEEAQWEEYESRWGRPERDSLLQHAEDEQEKDLHNVPVIVVFEA